jgi:transcriptional regulator with XRE-family HTH domain
MKTKNEPGMSRAVRDCVIDSPAGELEMILTEAGVDAAELLKSGRAAVARALAVSNAHSLQTDAGEEGSDVRQGLSALLVMLRRRDGLSEDELAVRARVDAAEVRRIEYDPSYTPQPRTIYQIEQFFKLPKRSLVRLAGIQRQQPPELRDEVLRFAANSKSIQKLSREETKLLNQFVRFLGELTDASGDS